MPPLTTELDELERGMNLIAEILGELTGADVSSITGGPNEDNLANA